MIRLNTDATVNVDDVITAITDAPTAEKALEIMAGIPAPMVRTVADQLHIDPAGHGIPWLCDAIVGEAKSLGTCAYSAAHTRDEIPAVTVIDCGAVGRVPACRRCAKFYARNA